MADSVDEQTGVTPGTGETPVTFEGWLAAQDETARGLIDGHVAGLKNALQSERGQRSELQKALKEATKELEQGTTARTKLEEVAGKMEAYEQQIAAYDTLQAAGVTNLKLAWIAAREAGAVDGRGNVNVETLKASFPELFKTKPAAPGNAGVGGSSQTGQRSMNTFIRKAAGRQ